ncbi:MAG: hypothetical protein IPI77_18060 [Saprospiraceae bacterium]|nr:hypothetical protein [Saprospiraceae bacterium]
MDIASGIVGIINILIILTFAIIKLIVAKNKRPNCKPCSVFVEENGCSLSQFDLWNNVSIGIDETSKLFLSERKRGSYFSISEPQ